MSDSELAIVRRAYAKNILFLAGLQHDGLERALAELPREDYLGPGPWKLMLAPGGYRATPSANPIYLYQDVLVAMMSEKGLNNGQPSFLVNLIAFGNPSCGEHIIHIGAGRGYYTAIMAMLVGESGAVQAIEYEPALAEQAAANLARFPHVRVQAGDGSVVPLAPADVIYINAGAVRPASAWLDAMNDGARMILPLTVSYKSESGHLMTRGAVFLITRQGDEYLAEWKSASAIYPCAGVRDPLSEAAIADAFRKGGHERVRRLYRTDDLPLDQCWVKGPGWALAYG